MKKITFLLSILGLSIAISAQTKITFEDAEIGSSGGATVGWGGTVDVMANPVTTGNASTKVLHANSTNYMPIYFGNVALPAGAETLYSTLRFKILVVGGGDVNYPTFNIFSSPDAWAFGSTPAPYKIAAIGYANLWGTAEIGVWKTVEFALSGSLLKPIPEGHLVLNLSKGSSTTANCEYLIDDVELVPAVAPAPVITLTDFESNTIGEVLNMRRYYPTDATATVEANPTNAANKACHILATNWNSALKLNVALPTGKTLPNYATLSFDIYVSNSANTYKQVEIYVDGTKKIDKENVGTVGAWETKFYRVDTIAAGNSFVLDIGLNYNVADYYLDNIKLTEITTGLTNNTINPLIIYCAGNTLRISEIVNQVDVYNLEGRLLVSAKNTSVVNVSNLGRGIYIVKAFVNGQTYMSKITK